MSATSHNSRPITVSLALAFTLSLAACGSDSSNSSDAATGTMPAPGANPVEPVTLEGLDGTWSQDCLANSADATFSTATLTAADNVATITQSVYTDNACTSAATPAPIETQRSLVFDDTTTSTSLGDASNVEWTVESKTIDGVSDTSDINGTVYDVMLITNGTLYFGDRSGGKDGTSEALRPTTLDQVNIFTSSE